MDELWSECDILREEDVLPEVFMLMDARLMI